MTTAAVRILGLDPGLQTTGFGVVDACGPRLAYVASGTIRTVGTKGGARGGQTSKGDLPARLKLIFEGVREVVQTYRPQCASVEIVFVNVNPQSTLLLGQARGAALLVKLRSRVGLPTDLRQRGYVGSLLPEPSKRLFGVA